VSEHETPLSMPLSPWCPAGVMASPSGGNTPRSSILSPLQDTVVVQDALDLGGEKQRDYKEIYISCCDAIGLGCMVTRTFVDFGLRIVSCDFSTDGRYCFIMFKVEPTPSTARKEAKDWALLRDLLVKICPADSLGALYYKPKFSNYHKTESYHILTVKCKDRPGLINWLMKNFWGFKTTIHRLKCTTTEDGEVVDKFYISDARAVEGLDPVDPLRAVIDSIKENLDAVVTVESVQDEYDTTIRRTRRLSNRCLDSSVYQQHQGSRSFDSFQSQSSLSEPLLASPNTCIHHAHEAHSSESPTSFESYCKATVEIDNWTSNENTILRCICPDRKGVLYDLFRLVSDVSLKASYGRIATNNSVCEALIFVKDSRGGQIKNEKAQEKLKDLIYGAIAQPFQLDLETSSKADCMELRVVAPVDTTGRGRPRVIFDVTTALCSLELEVFEAEMYVTGKLEDMDQKEVHLFYIKTENSEALKNDGKLMQAYKERIYETVFCELMGIVKSSKNSFSSRYPRRKRLKSMRFCRWLGWLGGWLHEGLSREN